MHKTLNGRDLRVWDGLDPKNMPVYRNVSPLESQTGSRTRDQLPNETQLQWALRVVEELSCNHHNEPDPPKVRKRRPIQDALSRYLRQRILVTPQFINPFARYSTEFFLQTDLLSFRRSIQAQIRGEFTWDSLGKTWDIGHRIDLAKFRLRELIQLRMAWHYTNLVPVGNGKKIRQPNREKIHLEMNRLYRELRERDLLNPYFRHETQEEWETSAFIEKPLWAYRDPPAVQ